jgi:hypothetical protein
VAWASSWPKASRRRPIRKPDSSPSGICSAAGRLLLGSLGINIANVNLGRAEGGGDAIALALSQARADAVAHALAERGVDRARVTANGTARDVATTAAARPVDVQLSPGAAPAGQENAS